jgi:multidrug efflux pump subunit AcrA (membrane-fusion protein)
MNPCVTTFRATWVGALGGLALFALALLPNPARAQAKGEEEELKRSLDKLKVELARTQDAAQAQAELEKARAELAKLQADIKARQEQIKLLEAKIAAMQAHKGGDRVEGKIVLRDPRGGDGNPNEIVIILRKVGDRWEVVQPPTKKPEAKQPEHRISEFRVEEKDGVLRVVPVEPGKSPPPGERPGGYRPVPALPEGKPADSRIDNLERQLKKIMEELESLRREMKGQPRPGATSRDETPHRIELRFDDLHKSLPPGTKVEEKDGVRYFTIPLEVKPDPKPAPRPEPKSETAPQAK